MAVATPVRKLTEADILEIERRADFKSEFFGGEMFAMAGGTRWHSLIAMNLGRDISGQLKGRACVAYTSDLRVKIEASGLYTYPDLSVACGEQKFVDSEADTLVNPTVIVEILSDSTEAYDRGKKFEMYRQIPSLKEYVLVSQREPRIEQFVRQSGGEWLLREFVGMDALIALPSLEITVALREIYSNVEFPPPFVHPEKPLRG